MNAQAPLSCWPSWPKRDSEVDLTLTFYVVFASDVHDIVCVAVPASNSGHAVDQVHEALGQYWDTMVFEHPPTDEARVWSLDALEKYYGH